MTVYVVLAQSRPLPRSLTPDTLQRSLARRSSTPAAVWSICTPAAVWIEGVGRSWGAADAIACFLADSDEWRGKRVLRDSTQVGTGWSLAEIADNNTEAWDLWITVHPVEVMNA